MLYRDYLKTEHWINVRSKFLSKKHNQYCKICGATDSFNVHHKRYLSLTGRNILFRENGSQLITLCHNCHNKFHKTYGSKFLGKKLLSRLQRESRGE